LEGDQRYLLNEIDPEYSLKFLDMGLLREFCSKLGFRVSLDAHVRIPEGLKEDQRRYLGIFKKFTIQRRNLEQTPIGAREMKVARPEPAPLVEEENIPEESLGLEDRFILVPRMLKKAAGTAAGESLKAESKKKYQILNKDTLWRAKLSDSFEGDVPIRMETGEMFKSAAVALIYYRAQFAGYEGYEALNLNSGLPYPENLKALSKAVVGKKGKEWKEQEARVMEKIYVAKFTNSGSQDDEPANLSPLRALLLTQDAQLYLDSKTRNELLEEIRRRLRVIYGNI
jgi:predicted NAD-dependent protein-ADP-ribosyltransferase YbiA (DUF1768 family)